MSRLALPLCAALLLAFSAGCRRPAPTTAPPPPGERGAFDGARALEEVRSFLAVGPRDATTPGAEKAAAYLKARLEKLGLQVDVDAFIDSTPLGPRTFRNVIARVPGTEDGLIVVGSHYDTKSGIQPTFEGANDSGSSCGVLLEIARVLAGATWHGPELQLVFFDGEEAMRHYAANDGFHGSRHHAARLVAEGRSGAVRGVIVLDMIGDRDLNVTLPRNSAPALAAAILTAAHEENLRDKFSLLNYQVGDDHEPFLEAGMPAVDLIDFLYGSAPGRNDYWHTSADTFDKLSADSLQCVGRVVLRALTDLSAGDAGH